MAASFITQATVLPVFRLTSKKEIRALKERFTLFEGIPDEDSMSLRHGERIIAATQTTGKSAVYRIFVLPTVTNVGGQTLRTTEG